MSLILNIGLARQGRSNIGAGTVLREIPSCGFVLLDHSLRHSNTELTVVANVLLAGDLQRATKQLALMTGQGCIAVWDTETQAGQLIGPKASEWGDFNPEFFLLLDGTPLAESLAAV